MVNYVTLNIYINKEKEILFVPFKVCDAGFSVACEPYIYISCDNWDNISQCIIDFLEDISKTPLALGPRKKIFSKICGKQGFKQFSKKHICINITYFFGEKKYIVSNSPRLSDGSYGVEKGTVSEKFNKEYVSMKNENKLQEDFLKAYDDAQQYLKEIGSKL